MSEENVSGIQEFFHGNTVFLTGATGYLGKLVLEKLLRGCPDISHIYLLIRLKKGKSTSARFIEIFESPIYESLKRTNPKFNEKVTVMGGDCAKPNLGLGEQDINVITSEVNCIIHCAATVRFDQKLSAAAKINIRATKDLLMIAHNTKNLKAFVHVSTAYSNCDRKDIDEVIYPPKIEGDKLLGVVDALTDDFLLDLQPRLLGNLPNTYTLTKQITESYIQQQGQDLPICIVKPSIITATSVEPLKGFIDNYYGPTGLSVVAGLGLMRSFVGEGKLIADFVPADYVVNSILSAAQYISKKRICRERCDPEVFNLVSSPENPISWGKYIYTAQDEIEKNSATIKMLWYPFVIIMQTNQYIHAFLWLTLHTIPAYIVDFVAVVLGKKPGLAKLYSKMWTMNDVISYFPSRQWTFSNNNTKKLFKQMSTVDKKMFNFNITEMDWDVYLHDYVRGIRVYVLKDSLNTLQKGKNHYRKLKIIHYITCAVLFSLALLLVGFSVGFGL